MEKSAFKFLVFLLICSQHLNAQDSLCVFKIKGVAFSKIDTLYKPLKQGTYILKHHIISLESNTSLIAINNKGNAFQINSVGDYDFLSILKHKSNIQQANLTKEYFKLVWDEITNQNSNTTIIGGVHRGETRMAYPFSNSKIVDNIIQFKWEIDSINPTSYFFLRQKDSHELLLKIATKSTSISFYEENNIFQLGIEYEWSISNDEYPDVNNLPFYSFKIITRKDYEKEKLTYTSLIKDLKTLKLSEEDIDSILCETYRICK
ncbi:hypothetical protein [Psychroserpens sp. MEBiC05023]